MGGDVSEALELQALFLREVHDGQGRAREALAQLGRDPADLTGLRELRGFFHRIAGTASTVGHAMLGRLAAACELAAEEQLERGGPVGRRAARILAEGLAGVDELLQAPPPPPALAIATPALIMPAPGPGMPAQLGLEDVPSRVLVVDDDPVSARYTEQVLRPAGFLTSICCDPSDAYEAILRESPDLIILDVVIGSVDGFDLCRRVRSHPALQLVPIIFVTRRGDLEQRVLGLQVGGNDYLAKPFEPQELVARVRSHLSRLSALREMAIRDGLTRCYNHKYFKMRLEQEIVRARRYGNPLSLGLLDVDHFKRINDQHGHPSGDAVLAHLANLLVASVRSTDIVARYGGEEFAFVLVEAGAQEAAIVAERMRSRLEAHDFELPGAARLRATASIGVAALQGQEAPAALIERVDAALYRAKSEGRNRVCLGTKA